MSDNQSDVFMLDDPKNRTTDIDVNPPNDVKGPKMAGIQ